MDQLTKTSVLDNLPWAAFWTTMEPTIAIVTACIPANRNLYRKIVNIFKRASDPRRDSVDFAPPPFVDPSRSARAQTYMHEKALADKTEQQYLATIELQSPGAPKNSPSITGVPLQKLHEVV